MKTQNKYLQRQAEIRHEAIEWQHSLTDAASSPSYGEEVIQYSKKWYGA
jgi:hypothetical protein